MTRSDNACASVAKFVDDVRVRSTKPGAIEVWLRRVRSDGLAPALAQSSGDDPGAAADIQHVIVLLNPGEVEERGCQPFTPATHEVFVNVWIGSQKRRHGAEHRNIPPLCGSLIA
jgi:hypothetical protein